MYNHADLSKTRNVCMHSWLHELNITNYYIILLNPFVFVYFLHADLAGFHTAEGGEGGAMGFPSPESNDIFNCFNTIIKHSNTCMVVIAESFWTQVLNTMGAQSISE